jgi:hypothetical protein
LVSPQTGTNGRLPPEAIIGRTRRLRFGLKHHDGGIAKTERYLVLAAMLG